MMKMVKIVVVVTSTLEFKCVAIFLLHNQQSSRILSYVGGVLVTGWYSAFLLAQFRIRFGSEAAAVRPYFRPPPLRLPSFSSSACSAAATCCQSTCTSCPYCRKFLLVSAFPNSSKWRLRYATTVSK